MMANNDTIISVKNVSKDFVLPTEKKGSLKQHLISFGSGKKTKKFNALSNVSFEINKGEFFGIVGRNGSGKSTLLKMLAGIYQPTKGSIKIKGRLTPFIELGIGFNPELTGKENVFLNGAILGLTEKQVIALYDEIVEFSELEKFMDLKLKNYSSGMQVRLAFAIAINAQNEILLVDEVLAVGDERFQEKCLKVFQTIKDDPEKTAVFVSHDMESVKRFCDRVLVLDKSKIAFYGNTKKAAETYHQINFPKQDDSSADEGDAIIKTVSYSPKKGLLPGGKLKIKIKLADAASVGGVGCALFQQGSDAYVFGVNTYIDNVKRIDEEVSLEFTLPKEALPGRYYVNVAVFGGHQYDVIRTINKAAQFTIEGETDLHGVINIQREWS